MKIKILSILFEGEQWLSSFLSSAEIGNGYWGFILLNMGFFQLNLKVIHKSIFPTCDRFRW